MSYSTQVETRLSKYVVMGDDNITAIYSKNTSEEQELDKKLKDKKSNIFYKYVRTNNISDKGYYHDSIRLTYPIYSNDGKYKGSLVINKSNKPNTEPYSKLNNTDLEEEKENGFKIDSIEYVLTNGKEYDLLNENQRKDLITKEHLKVIRLTIDEIKKQIATTNDYGLDNGLIYADIIANTVEYNKPIPKIFLYKQYFYNDTIKDDNINKINKTKHKNYTILIPDFSQSGHVKLLIINRGERYILDTQPSTNNGNNDGKSLIKSNNNIKDIQTTFNKGCCGFWITELVKEFENNREKYEDYFKNNDEQQKEELILELILNAAINVSNCIDDDSIIIKKEGDITEIEQQQQYIQLAKVNNVTYYIDKNCSRSKCINLEGIVSLINQAGETIKKETKKIEKEIEEQNRLQKEESEKQTETQTERFHGIKKENEIENYKKVIKELDMKMLEKKSKQESTIKSQDIIENLENTIDELEEINKSVLILNK